MQINTTKERWKKNISHAEDQTVVRQMPEEYVEVMMQGEILHVEHSSGRHRESLIGGGDTNVINAIHWWGCLQEVKPIIILSHLTHLLHQGAELNDRERMEVGGGGVHIWHHTVSTNAGIVSLVARESATVISYSTSG